LDEEALAAVKTYAADLDVPMGEAASLLIKRGKRYRCPTRWENGLLVFDPPPGTARNITPETIRRLEEEEDLRIWERSIAGARERDAT
jgi:hypothetical protein